MKYAVIVEIQGVGGDKDMKIIQPSIEILTRLMVAIFLNSWKNAAEHAIKVRIKSQRIQRRSLSVT